MGTSKRERQRANRDARKAEEEKKKKRDLLMSRVRLGLIWGLAIVIVLFGANLVFGGGGDDEPATTTIVDTTEAPATTDSPDTTTSEPTTTTEAFGRLIVV